VDEERHGPLALQMLVNLCGDRAEKWQEAQMVAEACLQARIGLWDGVVQQIAYAKAPEQDGATLPGVTEGIRRQS
jgi:hypothetical protein